MTRSYEVIICGAGIAGVSAAYFLAKAGLRDILLIDERPPLTLTSDRSTECYRNWWPDREILELMNRSIDLMEQLSDESRDVFHLNRRGYLYVIGDRNGIAAMKESALRISSLGGGPLRIHETAYSGYVPLSTEGFHNQPHGADLLIGNELIRAHFPYLTERAVAALHVRRAGWMSAQQLGMYLLERARSMGCEFRLGRVEAIRVSRGRVRGISLGSQEVLNCEVFVNAAGPFLRDVARLLGIELPVETELHLKASFRDPLRIVGRDAPLLIWAEPQSLPWSDDETAILRADPETRWLTQPLPGGAHTRPEGPFEASTILMLWDYKTHRMDPVFPPPLDEGYPEVVVRGLSKMLPGLRAYFEHPARPQVDAGYYVKTPENRLLASLLPVQGAYVLGAVSGYGIMSACGAGELLAAQITSAQLPTFAPAFSMERYENAEYLKQVAEWENSGQL